MSATQNTAIEAWLAARGLERLPESSYGEHAGYVMVPVAGRKSRVRVCVSTVSLRAMFARRRS